MNEWIELNQLKSDATVPPCFFFFIQGPRRLRLRPAPARTAAEALQAAPPRDGQRRQAAGRRAAPAFRRRRRGAPSWQRRSPCMAERVGARWCYASKLNSLSSLCNKHSNFYQKVLFLVSQWLFDKTSLPLPPVQNPIFRRDRRLVDWEFLTQDVDGCNMSNITAWRLNIVHAVDAVARTRLTERNC